MDETVRLTITMRSSDNKRRVVEHCDVPTAQASERAAKFASQMAHYFKRDWEPESLSGAKETPLDRKRISSGESLS